MSQLVTECQIKPRYCTDHSFVMIKIETIAQTRGPGMWMLNTSHLENDNYNQNIKAMVEKHSAPGLNPAEKWEDLKLQIIKTSKEWSKNHRINMNFRRKALIERMNLLTEEIQNSNSAAQTENLAAEN